MSAPSLVVASDKLVYREMMVAVLATLGLTQVQGIAAGDAFAPIQQLHPDLVLLDIDGIPSDTGWDTLHQMRSTAATNAIPVLVCTTDPQLVRDKTATLRAQGCEILEKPFSIDVLLEKISAMLDTEQARVSTALPE